MWEEPQDDVILSGWGLFDLKMARRVIGQEPEVQRLVAFTLAMAAYSLIAIGVAFRAQSMSLLGAAFHSLFTVATIGLAVIAILIMRQRATKVFSYGFERLEVVAAFTISSLMAFVSLFLVKEAIEALLEDVDPELSPDIEAHRPHSLIMFNISLLGGALQLMSVLLFSRYLSLRAEWWFPAVPPKFLPLLPHVLLFLCSLVVDYWSLIDGLVALILAALMMLQAIPAAYSSALVLLQSAPAPLKGVLEQGEAAVRSIEGVLHLDAHWWTCAAGVYVGSLRVRVHERADEQQTLRHIQAVFGPYIRHLTVQINKTT